MYSAKPNENDAKLDKVQRLHTKNLDRVRRGYTGQVVEHWANGELKKVEVKHAEEL